MYTIEPELTVKEYFVFVSNFVELDKYLLASSSWIGRKETLHFHSSRGARLGLGLRLRLGVQL